MTTEENSYRKTRPTKPRQPRQHPRRLTVQYRLVQAPDGLERLSKVYNILLQRGSSSSSKQLEPGSGDSNQVSGKK